MYNLIGHEWKVTRITHNEFDQVVYLDALDANYYVPIKVVTKVIVNESVNIDFDNWDDEEKPEQKVIKIKKISEVNVGDRVMCDHVGNTRNNMNKIGTIIEKIDGLNTIYVEFDDYIDGHTCNNRVKDGYGWAVIFGLWEYNVRKIIN